MKHLIGLALFSAAIAGCDTAESAPPGEVAATNAVVPEPMFGCWENVAANGAREWLQIDAASVRGQFVGGPVFQTNEIGPAMEAGSEGLVNIKITVPASSSKAAVSYELWMDETDVLRVTNWWGQGVAELDPEFTRCSAANADQPKMTS